VKGYRGRYRPRVFRCGGRTISGRGKHPLLRSGATRWGSTPHFGIFFFVRTTTVKGYRGRYRPRVFRIGGRTISGRGKHQPVFLLKMEILFQNHFTGINNTFVITYTFF